MITRSARQVRVPVHARPANAVLREPADGFQVINESAAVLTVSREWDVRRSVVEYESR